MPTRNISLTREQDEFVDEIVKAGEYQNASEAVRDALRALKQRREQDALKLELLRAQIELGVTALAGGDAVEIDDSEIESYLAEPRHASCAPIATQAHTLDDGALRISGPARGDLEHILATSLERWGEAGRARYAALLTTAMRAIAQ